MSGANYKNLAINIAEKQFAYTFDVSMYGPVVLGQSFIIQIGNLPISFTIEEIKIDKGLYSFSASNAEDEAVNNEHEFGVLTNQDHLGFAIPTIEAATKKIGKKLVLRIDEYNPAPLQNEKCSYLEFLSELIGWTDCLPQRQINAYCLGDTVYVIQRGKEQYTAELAIYEEPSITLKRVKLLGQGETTLTGEEKNQSSSTHTSGQDDVEEGDYLNGSWDYGDAMVTYRNGLVVKERHSSGEGTETTTYNYSSGRPPALLRSKRVDSKETIKETDYQYDYGYLVKETETTREKKGSGDPSIRMTRYYPLGAGFWATVVEEDGETTSTSIGQGASYGEASAYSIDHYSRKPFSIKIQSHLDLVPSIQISYNLLGMDSNLPVTSQSSLESIKEAIYWLNGKTEETVSLNCYLDRIVTHNHRILWRGNWYYLKSNQVTKDSRKTVQNITMVRWY